MLALPQKRQLLRIKRTTSHLRSSGLMAEINMLTGRLFILASLVVAAVNSAHACDPNADCRAIFTDPLSRKTTEGTDEVCELARKGCQLCAKDKANDAGVTLECANCVVARPADPRCIALCGGAAKVRTVYFAAGCM